MPKELGLLFQQRLDQASARLSGVTGQQAAEPFRPGYSIFSIPFQSIT